MHGAVARRSRNRSQILVAWSAHTFSVGYDSGASPPTMTQLRIGPKYGMEIPFYCPWCSARINADPYDHAYQHADKAPYAVDIVEEYWPPGLATHSISEGVY